MPCGILADFAGHLFSEALLHHGVWSIVPSWQRFFPSLIEKPE
jgi:hypothetical protein